MVYVFGLGIGLMTMTRTKLNVRLDAWKALLEGRGFMIITTKMQFQLRLKCRKNISMYY